MKKDNKKTAKMILASCVVGCLGFNSAYADNVSLRGSINEDLPQIQIKGGVKIDSHNKMINLSLRDTDIRQVLRMLADKSGVNIVLDDSVQGKVTVDLANVTVNKAFEYVMTLNKLKYWKDNNTIIVATSEKAPDIDIDRSKITRIKIKYVSPTKIADFINSNILNMNKPELTSANRSITTNPLTNELLVFGNDIDVELIKKMVDYLDIPPNLNTFKINFADPVEVAGKICMTAFATENDASSIQSSGSSGDTEGGKTTLVCGGKTVSASSSGEKGLKPFEVADSWVIADTKFNEITIYGASADKLNLIAKMVKEFDKKEPQVYIETSIIELSESGTRALAMAMAAGSGTEALSSVQGVTRWEHGSQHLSKLSDIKSIFKNFESYGDSRMLVNAINAVVQDRKGRVLANPRIIAANNTKSEIDITTDIVDTTTVETDNVSKTSKLTINLGSAGIKLSILPKISPNNYVTLSVSPSYSSVKQTIPGVDGSIAATLKNNRSLTTKNVQVKSGETIVIGGLIQESETNSKNKIPFLSDIPIIGPLFSGSTTDKERSELIIMITPRVIRDDVQDDTI